MSNYERVKLPVLVQIKKKNIISNSKVKMFLGEIPQSFLYQLATKPRGNEAILDVH